jgi:hypothetical protein
MSVGACLRRSRYPARDPERRMLSRKSPSVLLEPCTLVTAAEADAAPSRVTTNETTAVAAIARLNVASNLAHPRDLDAPKDRVFSPA